jgi:hypothetical protein
MSLNITQAFKKDVALALVQQRDNFGGSDSQFAKSWDLNPSVYSRLKKGERDGIIMDSKWLQLGRKLGLSRTERKWNAARTDVFTVIEEDIMFCQEHSKSRICADECGIGKTFTAKYLSRTLKNCFYIDASQAKTRQLFIRLIAKTIGVDASGKFSDVKEDLKYAIINLVKPIIIIDEAGDLDYNAFLELKELWNASEYRCGWYMIGADGLKKKIQSGISKHRVGFREIFSRYSENYTYIIPTAADERMTFIKKLIYDVLYVNMPDKSRINDIINKCITRNASSGLRRAESLLILEMAA